MCACQPFTYIVMTIICTHCLFEHLFNFYSISGFMSVIIVHVIVVWPFSQICEFYKNNKMLMLFNQTNATVHIVSSENCCLSDDYVCRCPTSHKRYDANNLIILRRSQVCDGKTDCPLGDDETCNKCEHKKYASYIYV